MVLWKYLWLGRFVKLNVGQFVFIKSPDLMPVKRTTPMVCAYACTWLYVYRAYALVCVCMCYVFILRMYVSHDVYNSMLCITILHVTPLGQYKSKGSEKPRPSRYDWVPVGMMNYNSDRKLYLVKREQFGSVNTAKLLTGESFVQYVCVCISTCMYVCFIFTCMFMERCVSLLK